MKNQEIVVILGNADKRDWHFILIQLFFQLLGRRDRLFKTYFRFNKIQDNPFRIMNRLRQELCVNGKAHSVDQVKTLILMYHVFL